MDIQKNENRTPVEGEYEIVLIDPIADSLQEKKDFRKARARVQKQWGLTGADLNHEQGLKIAKQLDSEGFKIERILLTYGINL